MDRVRGALRGRRDTYFGDVIPVSHRAHGPERGEQWIAHRRLRCQSHEREQLVPCPLSPVQLAFACEHIRQELVETCLAARQVILRVVHDVLD
jgi:hypothetical protein